MNLFTVRGVSAACCLGLLSGCSINTELVRVGDTASAFWNCYTLAYAPDGKTLTAMCADSDDVALLEFDTGTGEKLRHTSFIDAVSETYTGGSFFGPGGIYGLQGEVTYSPDGEFIAYAGRHIFDKALVWQRDSMRLLPVFELPGADEDTAVAFSYDNTSIAIGDVAGRIGVFDIRTQQLKTLIEIPNSTHSVSALRFAPENNFLLAAVVEDGMPSVRVWNLDNGAEILELPHYNWVTDIQIDAERRRVYTVSPPNALTVWTIGRQGEQTTDTLTRSGDAMLSGNFIAVIRGFACSSSIAVGNIAGYTNCFPLGDDKSGNVKGSTDKGIAVPRVAVAADGRHLATVDDRGTRGLGADRLRMHDAETLEVIWTATAERNIFDSLFSFIHDVAFSPANDRIAVAGGGIRFFDVNTGEEFIPGTSH